MARTKVSGSTTTSKKRGHDDTETASSTSKRSKISKTNDSNSATTRQKTKQTRGVRWKKGVDAGTVSTIDDENDASSVTSEDGVDASDGDGDDDDKDDDEINESSMAITGYQGRIGAAYFEPETGILFLLEDTQDSHHFDLTSMLFEQVKPDVLLASSRADERLIGKCQIYGDESSARFSVRPHREFVPERGNDRLLSLRILNQFEPLADLDYSETASCSTGTFGAQNAYDFMRRRQEAQGGDPTLKLWKASIRARNFSASNSPLCLSAVGALLEHLVRVGAATDLEGQDIGGLDVRSIEMVVLNQVMQINADALCSLQVFASEGHASMHSDKMKEGLSLFGILDHTRTKLGRARLKQWLLRPSLDMDIITSRHDALSCFLAADNLVAVDAMQAHLRGIKNIPRTLGTLRSGRGGLKEWTSLVKFTFHVTMLREAVGELSLANNIDVVQKIVSVIDVARFNEMGTIVNETIDWEASMNEGRVSVRHNIDPELDEKKRVYDGLDTFLAKVALRVADSVSPDIANHLNVNYLPQLGYLITTPIQEGWLSQADIPTVGGWQFQFSTDQQAYFKNQDMQDLDLHIGDLRSIITGREIEIMHALQERVMEYEDAMKASCDACSELDCLLSLTTASRIYDFVRPHMTTENMLEITNGRHPLQELCEDTFVPNSCYIVGGCGTNVAEGVDTSDEEDVQQDTEESQKHQKRSIVVCTGPNACGKSVYLKQNALIPLMAQVGCFVPAEAATIGIVDRIFTRIQTQESVGKTQSAFMIDLAQVSLALRNCTERSLIVLDEFGKGTLPSDGAGMLCGVLHHLLSKGTACPKVIATTHFHEIFSNNLLDMSLSISFLHMQVIISTESGRLSYSENFDDGDSEQEEVATKRALDHFTFLYSVAPGLSLGSHAAHCALLNGVPPRIVRRAGHVTELLLKHELTILLDEKMTEQEEKELEEAEQVTRKFCTLDLDPGQDHANVREQLAAVLGRMAHRDA
ncbi:MutS protein msh5 [Tulasnella sp. JGI-2019a]|nr:MutS protein msh5 [Tulasnella sp. JGI-2019a]